MLREEFKVRATREFNRLKKEEEEILKRQIEISGRIGEVYNK